MRRKRWQALALLGSLLALPAFAQGVEVGQTAPTLEADSTLGKIRLTDYQGKKHVVLAFYFKDFTGG